MKTNKDFDFIKKNKYAIVFLVIVFLAQILDLASDKISNSTIYNYFMYLCYAIMVFYLLTGTKNDKYKNLSRIQKIKKSLVSHPLRSLIIDSKKAYTEISDKHLLGGDVSKGTKKLEDNNTNQLKD